MQPSYITRYGTFFPRTSPSLSERFERTSSPSILQEFRVASRSEGSLEAPWNWSMKSMFSDPSASLHLTDKIYRTTDQEGPTNQDLANSLFCERVGDNATKRPGGEAGEKPHNKAPNSATPSLPDWLPGLLTMIQSTNAPHYLY
jgi:hypothetical protein